MDASVSILKAQKSFNENNMSSELVNGAPLTDYVIISCQTMSAIVAAEPVEPSQPVAGKHFVLVHDASLGAWSWYKVVPLLRSYGHNVTAINLGVLNIDLRRVNDIFSFADYVHPLMDFMASLPALEKLHYYHHLPYTKSQISTRTFVPSSITAPLRDFMASLPPHEKVVLVGQSFAGFAISQSTEFFPEKISVAVFVTAVMPGPSYNVTTLNQNRILTQNLSEPDNSFIYGDGPNNPPTAFIFGPQ
ncbi:hypothetical protein LguiB_022177 [Lonicera macranthoides]